MINRYKNPLFIFNIILNTGSINHKRQINNNNEKEDIWNIIFKKENIKKDSFPYNFKASENGCISPKKPNLLGPFRCWNLLNILRSIKVKKLMDSKIDNKKKKKEKTKIKCSNNNII